MIDTLRDVAMVQYGKLEYPVTHEELYCAGFEACVKYVYDMLREEQLKEVDRTMDRVLYTLASWKPEIEKKE